MRGGEKREKNESIKEEKGIEEAVKMLMREMHVREKRLSKHTNEAQSRKSRTQEVC